MTKRTTAYSLADWLGYLTREEVDLLKEIATKPRSKNPVFVNIGAGAGTSGLALAEARPEADLYTIDIREDGPLGSLKGERNAFERAEMIHPTQILGDSKKIGKEWKLSVDLIFIDGDHSKAGIRGDIETWLPHVKRGGYVIFHDYENTKWSDVKVAVDELMSDYKVMGKANRVIVFKKTKAKSK